MKKQISLTAKLTFYIVTFIVTMLFVIWFFQTVLLENFYSQIKTNTVKQAVDSISLNSDIGLLQDSVVKVASELGVCIRIVAQDYEVLSETGNNCAVSQLSYDQINSYGYQAIINGSYQTETKEIMIINSPINPFTTAKNSTYETGNRDILYVEAVEQNNSIVLVFVSTRISPVNATVETLKVQLMYISVTFIILAIVLAIFITFKVVKPIVKINEKTKILATGNYDVEFNADGYKEIKELSDTLNYAVENLKVVDKTRRDLIANVSHDLRTPLTMVEGYAEMMRDLPNENTPENAQIIIDEAKRLTFLVNDLLELNKLQNNTVEKSIEEFDLSELVVNVIERYEKYYEKQKFIFETEIDENLIVESDSHKLEQVLYNFINNAIHYAKDSNKIIIKCIKENDYAHVEVTDFGSGIAEENLNQIWDRYYKIDKEHVRTSVGSGIGLSICKEIFELYEIDYGVKSKVNEGSTFWFNIKLK